MPLKIRYGVLSTANIALKKVIPGMQRSSNSEIVAIASRDLSRAQQAASAHAIPRAYGSYEALLADPGVDAIYNPLPNDLHAEWTIKAAEAGKHVLCEKPIALTVDETRQIIAARDRTGVKIGEAFMVHEHPQWLRARDLIAQGTLGELHLIQGAFSYFNTKPENIRNSVAAGGGALMDIGCYLTFLARYLFQAEPTRVLALIDRDPTMHIDRLSSFILDFGGGRQFVGSSSTQLIPYQRIQAFGTKGRLEVEIPVNVPPDTPVSLKLDLTGDLYGAQTTTESFPPEGAQPGAQGIDQYTLQADAFSSAILDNTPVPVPLEQALANMKVIEALFRSAETNSWQAL